MNEAKFTKGLTIKGNAPTCDETDGVGDYALIDPDGRIVGEAYRTVSIHDKRPARENALLWAAAPKMYEALETLVDTFWGTVGGGCESDLRAAKELLAAARGES